MTLLSSLQTLLLVAGGGLVIIAAQAVGMAGCKKWMREARDTSGALLLNCLHPTRPPGK